MEMIKDTAAERTIKEFPDEEGTETWAFGPQLYQAGIDQRIPR